MTVLGGWLYGLFYHIGLEFVAFVLVDVVVKNPLRDAGSEQEKRTIWLYESLFLCLLCGALYFLHHVPYVLILLTSVTFIYTQLVGRTQFSVLVANLRAQWENHLQHEENMKQIERQKQQQQHLQQQALGMAGLNNTTAAELANLNVQNQQQGYNPGGFPFNRHGNLHYPPNATVVPGQDRPTYSMSPNSASYRNAVQQSRELQLGAAQQAQNWNNTHKLPGTELGSFVQMSHPQGAVRQSPEMPAFNTSEGNTHKKSLWSNLQRRSLRPSFVGKLSPSPQVTSSIRSRFMNVIGLGPSEPKPVGLVNAGQNMCFINSIIQCLARAPFLASCLTADAAKELECTVAESDLLSSLAEVLDILTVDPANAASTVFDAVRLRKAISILNPCLVTPPGDRMNQQDAAEFLMWLLHTLHGILNKNRQAIECDSASLRNEDRFNSPCLAKLRLIYRDLDANRIKELKDQCRMEIAAANGLENKTYAEAIQRLSDLEWLTHKQANDTVIDGLFSGHLVEAYHSIDHGHISVNLQVFNVLPVPISSPRYESGLVMLEDCFTNFCNIENMVLDAVPGSSGSPHYVNNLRLPGNNTTPMVHISNPVRRRNVGGLAGYSGTGTPITRGPMRLLQQEAAVTHMPSPIHQSVVPSPVMPTHPAPILAQTIPLSPVMSSVLNRDQLVNDSGFQDSNFRTSTPIGPEGAIPPASHLMPRLLRRCLLRQLPECLTIQLMRFRYDQEAKVPTKINTSVSIRLRNFNLRDVLYDTVTQRNDMSSHNGSAMYELYGLCLHLGASSTAHGHYISYCQDGDKWYRFDDQNVQEVNMEYQLTLEEIRQNAYLLFYRRMNLDSV